MSPWIGMGRPGIQTSLPDVEDIGRRLRAEVAAIEALGSASGCRICGAQGSLTEEHAPSKRAGNRKPLLRRKIDYERSLESGEIVWTAKKIAAATFDALCGICNNNTGTWYNPAYVRFSDYCATIAAPENAGRTCDIELEVHPQRVAKQALAFLLAASQPGVTERYPHLRQLIVGKEDARRIEPIRLCFYLRANPGGRVSGLAMSIDLQRRAGRLIDEFSFGPLGWLVTFDGSEVEGTVDVSSWTERGYHDKGVVKLVVPCQWAISSYPADFRPPSTFARLNP